MGIGNTKIDLLLRRTQTLSEAEAWLLIFDTSTKQQIIEWVQQDQLFKRGVDKTGQVIGYYSLTTELISNGRKKFNEHYTFLDTGEFFRSMYVAVFLEEIQINANPKKGNTDLFAKYGTGIIGLTDENFSKLKEIAKNKYIDYARQILFGG